MNMKSLLSNTVLEAFDTKSDEKCASCGDPRSSHKNGKECSNCLTQYYAHRGSTYLCREFKSIPQDEK